MKKKIVLSMIAILAATSISVFADINIKVNGNNVPFSASDNYGVPFVDENNRTLVPFRKTLEFAGATVGWNAESKTAIAEKNGIKVEVPIGQKYIFIDGAKQVIDTNALIKEGRTYLPIRAVLEALEYEIGWEQATQTVVATTEDYVVEPVVVEPVEDPYKDMSYDAIMNELTTTNSGIEILDLKGQENKVEFAIHIRLLEPLEPQYKEAEAYLNYKIGEELTKEVMEYARTKQERSYNLETKFYDWNDTRIQVGSPFGSYIITVRGL